MRMKLPFFLLSAVLLGAAPPPVPPRPMPLQAASIDFGGGQRWTTPPGGIEGDGISVAANGFTTAQATRATLNLQIQSRTPSITRSTLTPILDALVESGVSRSSLVLPPILDRAPTNFASIRGTVEDPSVAKIESGIATVSHAFAANPDLFVNGGFVELSRAGCEPDVERARANAIRAGRKRAEKIASQAGIHVGKLLAITVVGEIALDSDGSCSGAGFSLSPGSPPQPSLANYLAMRIDSNVAMRFAIRP